MTINVNRYLLKNIIIRYKNVSMLIIKLYLKFKLHNKIHRPVNDIK